MAELADTLNLVAFNSRRAGEEKERDFGNRTRKSRWMIGFIRKEVEMFSCLVEKERALLVQKEEAIGIRMVGG